MKYAVRSRTRQSRPQRRAQRGIALVVGLVILVVLALLGTAAYSVATQEERMAGNARDHARAFQAAEYALRQCEQTVVGGPMFGVAGTSPPGMLVAPVNGTWLGDSPANAWQPVAWSLTQYNPAGLSQINTGTSSPACIAESFEKGAKLNPSKPLQLILHTARVTAVGFGITSGTKVTLVSYFNFFSAN
jgi:type IV pilus assembly protein PilX